MEPDDRADRQPVSFTGAGSDAGPLEPHWVELSALVTRAECNRAEVARLQAERAEICAASLELVALRVEQRRVARGGRVLGDDIPLREVIAELACALRVGERTISSWLGDGAALVGTYPATLEALREGRIDERHASAIIDGGMPLDADIRPQYEELVLPVAENATAAELRETARVIAARLQPDILEDAAKDALAARRVRMFALRDGLSRLLVDAPAALIHGIFERITDMAVAIAEPTTTAGVGVGVGADAGAPLGDNTRPPGETDTSATADARAAGSTETDTDADVDVDVDARTLDQRRADVACDLLLCGAPVVGGDTGLGAIRATVHITIPILTLAGVSNEPAILDGHGPIDADTARQLAGSAPCWQRVMIHPVTAEPLRLDTYRPSNRLRRLLNARDRCCRWPGCRRPARRSEADHTIPFSEGGPTCPENMEIFCIRHHHLKHASLWHVEHLGGGTLQFTSPTRRRYRNDAPPVTEGRTAPRWAHLLNAPHDPGEPPPF